MGTILKEVMVFREHLTCDKPDCNNAVMSEGKMSSLGNMSNPGQPMFNHTCPICGDVKTLTYRFPRIVYKELPTIYKREEAIDQVIGKINDALEDKD